MSNKNRIEQPYGYREQNKFSSEPSMLCKAITSKTPNPHEIIEKINFILSHGYFQVSYDRGLESYSFMNAEGGLVGAAKLFDIIPSDLITDMGYNQETKKIFVKFDNDQTLEIPLDALVSNVEGLVEGESSERASEDNKIWDAIGDLSGSTESSGKSLLDMIKEEVSARTDGDGSLWDALNQEISAREANDAWLNGKLNDETAARESEDQRIWDAIGEMGASGTNLVEMIRQEISDRQEADTAEASAREEGDNSIWEALSAETQSREANDAWLNGKLNDETEAREGEDQRIWDAIGELESNGESLSGMIQQEISERVSSDDSLREALSAETQARESNDAWLNNKLNEEISNRENGDNDLWDALNQEISAREGNDTSIREELAQEKIDRSVADGELDGKISAEVSNREASENNIIRLIDEERTNRVQGDNDLTNALNTERNDRESSDNSILNALNLETQNRMANDATLSGMVENNKVSIVKVQTSLPTNVKEAYELKNRLGEVLGERINIYKDSSLKDVELVGSYQGRQGQFLKFTYILDDGSEKEEYVDVSSFLVEAEFKDGLLVTNAGEVKVRIDAESETYLTVSPYGVRLSGIDTIANNLSNEINRSTNKDTELETLITAERTRAITAEGELNVAIGNEQTRATSAETTLTRDLSQERSEREHQDSVFSLALSTETSERQNNDQTLYNQIVGLNNSLTNESNQRASKDNDLQNQIDLLKSADITLNGRITTVETSLASQVSILTTKDADLQTQINRKANSEDVYYKTEADSIFARKTEIPTDFYGKAEVDAKDSALSGALASEKESRESEDVVLYNLITANTASLQNADNILQENINSVASQLGSKLVAVTNKDVSVSVDNTDATRPAIKTNISTEANQIIKLNADGLYAKATLDYDTEKNELTFTTTNAEPKRIRIQSQSEINRIYYDASNEEIVIEYTVNGSRMENVRVPVGDLIEEWRVEDGNQGAIALAKTRKTGGDKDVLSARLVLNTAHGDNAAIIDDNALYVSTTAITAPLNSTIAALEARVAALEAALENANTLHNTQSGRIAAVEQKNASQDDQIAEINTKNASQDSSIADLLNYINVNTEP